MKCAALTKKNQSCSHGITTGCVFTIKGWQYRVCRQHYVMFTGLSENDLFMQMAATRRTQVNTNAVINSDDGVTNIDLQSGVETHQPKLWDGGEGVCCAAFQTGACVHTEAAMEQQEERVMEDIIDRPNSVFFYAVRGNGFRKEHEVPTFYYWKAGRVMVQDQNNLESLVQKHFQLHGSTKYIVIRVYGRVWCYKKDLTVKEMGSCVIKQSRF